MQYEICIGFILSGFFSGDMRVDNTGQLQLNMASKDNWEQPFGLKNIQFSNSNLSATFEPGLPVPTFGTKSIY